MIQMVIDRTFDGYQTEIKTIYGQLEHELGVKIEPAPDEWDRLFNKVFYIYSSHAEGKGKHIRNKEVIEEIKAEIEKLHK